MYAELPTGQDAISACHGPQLWVVGYQKSTFFFALTLVVPGMKTCTEFGRR